MTSLDDLTKWSRHELMRLQNVGATKVSYIEAAMSKLGLSLRDDGEFIEHESRILRRISGRAGGVVDAALGTAGRAACR
jgi:hypothetical protein